MEDLSRNSLPWSKCNDDEMQAFTFQQKLIPSNTLYHPIQDRLSLLISKNVWHNFIEKYSKISVFLAAVMLMILIIKSCLRKKRWKICSSNYLIRN